MANKGNLNVTLEGRGSLILRPGDHAATGGEGAFYKASGTGIKIFHDERKVQWNNIEGKVAFFKSHPHPYVVMPQGKVIDKRGKVIGYYMEFINGEPIARVFTNDFWTREGFNNNDASLLAERMREIVLFAHKNNALLIDANELGYFVIRNRSREVEPRIIDVDCWVIDNQWPPTVPIMPSIRDLHVKKGKNVRPMSQETDWFSWGIVTFQVYTGIHPYKGTLKGYTKKEMEKRMKENASIFSPGIKLNRNVRDFNTIPGKLLDWYFQTFHKGLRTFPPSPFDTGLATAQIGKVMYATTTASGTLVFESLYKNFQDPVVRIFPTGIVLTQKGKLINLVTKQVIGNAESKDCELVKIGQGWLKADIDKTGKISCSYINEKNPQETFLNLPLSGSKIVRYENRLFLVTMRGLTELSLKFLGKPILVTGNTWGAMVNSTEWFDGVGIQDDMGAVFLIAPHGDLACSHVRVPELDGLKSIIAKAGNRFITIVAMDKSGAYKKLDLTFSKDYKKYECSIEDTDTADLNITILPKGVCAVISQDNELDILVYTAKKINKVQDKKISTNMILANWENKVVYIQNGDVWSVRMR